MTKKPIVAGGYIVDKNVRDRRVFPAGQVLFRQGSPVTAAYLVQQGRVSIYQEDISGHIIPLAEIGPGEVLGEMALLSHKDTHSVTAKLIEDSIIVLITKEYIDKCYQEAPPILKNIIESLVCRLYQSNDRVKALCNDKNFYV